MAGIALVKGAADGIKAVIGSAKDVSEIAGYIDKLFEGEKQVQHARSKKSSVGSLELGGVASEIIDARLAKEKMDEIRQLVDFRFGHGTWKSIVDERARRIQEQKETERKAKAIARQKHEEAVESAKQAAIIICIVLTALGLFSFLILWV